jgi:hypothetical protein
MEKFCDRGRLASIKKQIVWMSNRERKRVRGLRTWQGLSFCFVFKRENTNRNNKQIDYSRSDTFEVRTSQTPRGTQNFLLLALRLLWKITSCSSADSFFCFRLLRFDFARASVKMGKREKSFGRAEKAL